jgi:hypothetical protein
MVFASLFGYISGGNKMGIEHTENSKYNQCSIRYK